MFAHLHDFLAKKYRSWLRNLNLDFRETEGRKERADIEHGGTPLLWVVSCYTVPDRQNAANGYYWLERARIALKLWIKRGPTQLRLSSMMAQ